MKLSVRLFCLWLALRAAAYTQSTVRVGLFTLFQDRQMSVAHGPGRDAWLRTCEGCTSETIHDTVNVQAAGNRVAYRNNFFSALWLSGGLILGAHGEQLAMPYPLEIKAREGKLVLIATMPLESYVERVVASESSSADSTESLKALAVVVRSFALHVRHGHADFDVCDSTHCQLLRWSGTGPGTGRGEAAHAAVLATAGETLWFHERRAEAWFHQNSGGHTASPNEVWAAKAHGMPWLAGQVDRHGVPIEWTSQISREELTGALAQAGLAKPGWVSLTVTARGESGRAIRIRLDAVEISAEDFRLAVGRALGWNRIPSTWFEVSRQGDEFLFRGRGHGHGVGLSQAGAAAMAEEGSNYEQILAQYFPGARTADEASGASWQSFAGHEVRLETLDASDKIYLPQLNRAMQEAEQRSGLHGTSVVVRTFHSTEAFREGTLAPGWVAAFTEGNWIGVQPLNVLAQRNLLASVIRHEMLHALVESSAAGKTPLWLREGLVEVWNADGDAHTSTGRVDAARVEEALVHAQSEAESAKAHREAGVLAAQLLQRFGQAHVLDWLRQGLPAEAVNGLR